MRIKHAVEYLADACPRGSSLPPNGLGVEYEANGSLIHKLKFPVFIALLFSMLSNSSWAARPYHFEQLELAILQTDFENNYTILLCSHEGCDKPLQINAGNSRTYFYQVKIIAESGQLGLALIRLTGPQLAQNESAPIFVNMGDNGQGKTDAVINIALNSVEAPTISKSLVWRAIEPPLAHLHIVIMAR